MRRSRADGHICPSALLSIVRPPGRSHYETSTNRQTRGVGLCRGGSEREGCGQALTCGDWCRFRAADHRPDASPACKRVHARGSEAQSFLKDGAAHRYFRWERPRPRKRGAPRPGSAGAQAADRKSTAPAGRCGPPAERRARRLRALLLPTCGFADTLIPSERTTRRSRKEIVRERCLARQRTVLSCRKSKENATAES